MRAVVGADASRTRKVGTAIAATTAATTNEMAISGAATITARSNRGGQTSSPSRMTRPISTMRRPAPVSAISSSPSSARTIDGFVLCIAASWGS